MKGTTPTHAEGGVGSRVPRDGGWRGGEAREVEKGGWATFEGDPCPHMALAQCNLAINNQA